MNNSEVNDVFDWWPSPAKINLFLHVCGRFENGYHDLQTLFQILDFGDEIGFSLRKAGLQENCVQILDNIDGLDPQDNLIVKAAQALLPYRTLKSHSVEIKLNKRIPMGGGLGGGSSNAATTLLALNKLWQCECDLSTLLAIGKKLGADVPVFIKGQTAFASGIGEKLQSHSVQEQIYLVASPNVHVSTAAVFTHPSLPRQTQKIDFAHYKFEQTQNDCEKLVCNMHPEVANLLQWLLNYAPSRMTGTGASVFSIFESVSDAKKVLKKLPAGTKAFIAKGLDCSPVLQKLAL
ncbi:4-(cytidine 5'-diphospho)-2-C-methyl-D-erythritol kinase [Glaciecola petra]|uniref:4-diphosphocytidyl-2-C-methyl-D-erythritol kinase n=1 Tax=Glaciecola petra TaxID=3075602 RepID=A0ABU2ZN00_9ALTE|nr:4-(cytidine 5'-diphospho)-2-C-methyl-D-erythritol kinase [Aestuariibacter sp. P117]MDT0594000.1 4-(cytidine 5'-diphospho)-2-C-methyl-D-erythritol kinase [Aestuariibacter sp. P117]